MRKLLPLIQIIFILITASAVLGAGKCVICGKPLRGSYLQGPDGKTYCSHECFNKTRPLCSVCGKRVGSDYLKRGDEVFCSRKCFEATLPKCEICQKPLEKMLTIDGHVFCESCAALDRCFQCQLPYSSGRTLPDGRHICSQCDKQGVYSAALAEKIYLRAAREVELFTGIVLRPLPAIRLTGIDKMKKLTPEYDEKTYILRGTYQSQTTLTKTVNIFGKVIQEDSEQSGTVFILYGLSKRRFLATASHELTHDLIEKSFPKLLEEDLWLQEGLCQYVAHAVAVKLEIDESIEEIENYNDDIYGKGFQWYKDKFGYSNWRDVQVWLQNFKR